MQDLSYINIKKTIVPVIRWSGSKRYLAPILYQLFPQHNRYIEPFVGGGSMLAYSKNKKSIASDIYSPLINFWNIIKYNPEDAIIHYNKEWNLLQQSIKKYQNSFELNEEQFPPHYYNVRNRFNQNHNPLDLQFLTRTCVNGIVRFNQKSEFNSSFHLTRKGMNPTNYEYLVRIWNKYIRKTKFITDNYKNILNYVNSNDFIYLDPPYHNNKAWYINQVNSNELFNLLHELNTLNIKWMLSYDGIREQTDYSNTILLPQDIYKYKYILPAKISPSTNVLNKNIEYTNEFLYINYEPPIISKQLRLMV